MGYDRFLDICLTDENYQVDEVFGKWVDANDNKIVGGARRQSERMNNAPIVHLGTYVQANDNRSMTYLYNVTDVDDLKERCHNRIDIGPSSEDGKGVISLPLKLSELENRGISSNVDVYKALLRWVSQPGFKGKIRFNCHGGLDNLMSMNKSKLVNAGEKIGNWLLANGLIHSGQMPRSGVVDHRLDLKVESGIKTINIAACWTGSSTRQIPADYNAASGRFEPKAGSLLDGLKTTLRSAGAFDITLTGAFSPTTTSTGNITGQRNASVLVPKRIPNVKFNHGKYETWEPLAIVNHKIDRTLLIDIPFADLGNVADTVQPGLNGHFRVKNVQKVRFNSLITDPRGTLIKLESRDDAMFWPLESWVCKPASICGEYEIYPPPGWTIEPVLPGDTNLTLSLKYDNQHSLATKSDSGKTVGNFVKTSHSLTKCETTT
ncbi:hypothetical protein [Pseudoalteromonas phenolica]|uniref:Uncharacterized protein n=1 Tax=Pseudoalteromonas phenolica TaxID=161398 RepID=A0A0S2K200_9GAMM|nr:hypothetical protein [Pseudoalteromonas phenolica]ALO42522.1 hypothetical protein PP2015_2024 [Pseudoalteromonas phenolica]MBE0356376.1 hypothetical protein [Pseudoalteromonas phenolica O-BC30]RXF04620.1 hypothetical protein D9981_03960 [Pseudoalteromonas phenolica O-BC30]